VGNITDVEVTAGGITVNPDTNGVYSITIEEGTYDVVASLTNYEDSTITDVEVLKNQTTSDINFTLQSLPGSISGTVSLTNRVGDITEVEITAGGITANPDSTGNYSMTIAPGTYDVSASLANYIDSTITDVVVLENQATTDVNFTLIAMPGTINGTVSLASRAWSITEAEVTAGGVMVNPDSTGAYSLGLQPGIYDVNASLTNYMDSTIIDVQVIENQDTTGVDFTMEAAYGSIEGFVSLIGGTGDVVDVEITAGGQTTNPDDSGYYVINNLLPGFYDVSATLNGYPTGHVQDVEVQLLQITSNINFTLISGPPDVDFTAVPDSGCAPIEVQFTDESTAQPTSWLWQFGDGTTNTEQNPTHLYSEPGTYTVSLTATNSTGSSTLIRDDLIKAGEPPTANFGASPTAGTAPLGVSFINQSVQVSGFPTTWQWDFGDGGTSNSQSPGHVYQEAGIYSVELIASNDCGVDTLNRTDYITVYSEPMADFGATPLNGCQPLTVNFTDSSANIPTSWQWDFGDGATTTAQNPNHEYDEWGIFTVSLTVSNPAGSDTETKTDYITVNGKPIAEAGPDQVVAENEQVTLDGSASYDPEGLQLNYHWQAPDTIQLSDTTIVNPTFMAPSVEDTVEYNFVLIVDDSLCYSEPDTVVISVKDDSVGIDEQIPADFELMGVYPNPVKSLAKISFALNRPSKVNIELYDLRGRFVEVIMSKEMDSGYHTVHYNMQNLKSGIYFYKVSLDGVNKDIKKIILLR